MDEGSPSMVGNGNLLLHACCMSLLCSGSATAVEYGQRMDGDIGAGGYLTRSIVHGGEDTLSILPYTDFTYGRFFARVDTFGFKALPVGYGYLELVGRFNQDGYRTDVPALSGLHERKSSIPLGFGTLQVTPVGGFYLNAFHDVNKSNGNLLEFVYGARFAGSAVTIYPLAGMEYRSASYVRYYYGIADGEAATSGFSSYRPAGSYNSFLGLIADIRLSGEYHLNFYFRRKFLGDSIRNSPVADSRYQDTAYLAISYRYR